MTFIELPHVLNIFLRTSVSPSFQEAPVLTDKIEQFSSFSWRQSCQVVINELTHSCHELKHAHIYSKAYIQSVDI